MAIQKRVVVAELLKVLFGVYLVAGIYTGWIDSVAADRTIGVGGLMCAIYMIFRSATDNEHGNLALRLKGDDRKIPTTTKHRILTLSLGLIVLVGSSLMLSMGWPD